MDMAQLLKYGLVILVATQLLGAQRLAAGTAGGANTFQTISAGGIEE